MYILETKFLFRTEQDAEQAQQYLRLLPTQRKNGIGELLSTNVRQSVRGDFSILQEPLPLKES